MSRTIPQNQISSGRRRRRLPFYLSAVALLAAASASSQPDPAEPTLSEEEQVTAVDLLLAFDRDRTASWAAGRGTPKDLEAADFEVRVGGAPVPVVSVEALEDSADPAWNQVVWIDCRMTSTPQVRRAVAALQARAADLAALGTLSVVVADPAPTTVLRPTRDASDIERALSSLAVSQRCRDDVMAIRDQLARAGDGAPAPSPAPLADAGDRGVLARAAMATERTAVRRSALGMVGFLTDPQRGTRGVENVLYLIHGGFDPEPQVFYGRFLGSGASAEPESPSANRPPLSEGTAAPRSFALSAEDLGRLLGSYGWTVVTLGEGRPTAGPPGAYIGSWYFSAARPRLQGDPNPELKVERVPGQVIDSGDPWQLFLGGIRAKLRENLDPDKADGYLELGRALYGQEKYERAEESFRKALYHFGDHPRTRKRQAEVWVALGNTLAARGRSDLARRAVEEAMALDPTLAEREGIGSSSSSASRAASLERLATATVGRAVVDPLASGDRGNDLDRAFEDLRRRVRLTYQVAGLPDGTLRSVEATYGGGTPIRHPGASRDGTPERVAEARLWTLLDEDLGPGLDTDRGLDVLAAVRFDSSSGERRGTLTPADLGDGLSPALRLSMAWGQLDEPSVVEHRRLGPEALDSEVDLGWPGNAGWMAILVEDLDTGAWGAHLFDL
ncbi:MAG: tetratricopeptide repeat protein [Acidobacteriota bacterium]